MEAEDILTYNRASKELSDLHAKKLAKRAKSRAKMMGDDLGFRRPSKNRRMKHVKANLKNLPLEQRRAMILRAVRNPVIRAKMLAKLNKTAAASPRSAAPSPSAPSPGAPTPFQDDTQEESQDESQDETPETDDTDSDEGDDNSQEAEFMGAILGLSVKSVGNFTTAAGKIAVKTGGHITPANLAAGAKLANQIRSGDPSALKTIANLNAKAKRGDKKAKKAVAVVKAGDKLAIATGVSVANGPAANRGWYGTGLALSRYESERKYGK